MKWYYAVSGDQLGPVSDAELGELARSGKIQAGALVWHAGQDGWLPYDQVAAGAGMPQAAAPPPPPLPTPAALSAPATGASAPGATSFCAVCGQQFDSENMIHYMGSTICMACKPAFFQRQREGAGITPAAVSMNYAGFLIRFAAKFIDGLVFLALLIPFFLIILLGSVNDRPGNINTVQGIGIMGMIFVLLAMPVIAILVNGTLYHRYQASLGKLALGLRITDAVGLRMTKGKAYGRAAMESLLFLPFCGIWVIGVIGCIIASFDVEKRALQDYICGTRVIRK